jgi:hypothetical protein
MYFFSFFSYEIREQGAEQVLRVEGGGWYHCEGGGREKRE